MQKIIQTLLIYIIVILPAHASQPNILKVSPGTGVVNGTGVIEIEMENTVDITGLQFDVTIPAVFTVLSDEIKLSDDRSDNHSISTSEITGGTWRVLSFSTAMNTYKGNSGVIVEIPVEIGDVPGEYSVTLSNVILGDINGNNVSTGHAPGTFTVTDGDFSERSVDVNAGWNLVGLPLEVENPDYKSLFPEAVDGTLYSFNGHYQQKTDMEAGTGFWLRFNADATVEVTGVRIQTVTITLSQGWNLISGPSDAVPLGSIDDPDGIIVEGTLYEFNGSYEQSGVIEPGKGYWLRARTAGSITISTDG